MQAEIIFTGSEILLGEILNTHTQYMGQRLTELGIEVTLHTTVGDHWDRMAELLRQALVRSDLIFTTGGLGPTTDDLTKEVVAEVLGLPMELDEGSLSIIREFFNRRGVDMPENNKKQAIFPADSKILPNPRGTAPGAIVEHQGKSIIILPGPPWELKTMFEEYVVPYLNTLPHRGLLTTSKIFRLTGIGESTVQELMDDLGGRGNPEISFLARPGEVEVRVTAKAKDFDTAESMVDKLGEKVRKRLTPHIFAVDNEKIEEVVGELLNKSGMTIAVAESCTGGLIQARLTDVSGSSRYLKGGIVAYSNLIKENMLNIPAETLLQHGVVSWQTAVAMAEGIRKLSRADLGLAVTGIAGPTSPFGNKPVGLVYIALATASGTCHREYRFPGERHPVRQGTVNASLKMVKQFLLGN